MTDQPTLDCQDCGTVLRNLSDEEAQAVATNPYNFICYCRNCRKAHQ
jgi:uncharacterized protein with PIN domain